MDQQQRYPHIVPSSVSGFTNAPVSQGNYAFRQPFQGMMHAFPQGVANIRPFSPSRSENLFSRQDYTATHLGTGNYTQGNSFYGQHDMSHFPHTQGVLTTVETPRPTFTNLTSASGHRYVPPPQGVPMQINTNWEAPGNVAVTNAHLSHLPSTEVSVGQNAILSATSVYQQPVLPSKLHPIASGAKLVKDNSWTHPAIAQPGEHLSSIDSLCDDANIKPLAVYKGQPMLGSNSSQQRLAQMTKVLEPKISLEVNSQQNEGNQKCSEGLTLPSSNVRSESSDSELIKGRRRRSKEKLHLIIDEEDEEYEDAEDDIRRDPLFDPNDDSYVETPENSDGSGDEFVISKRGAKRKSAKKKSSSKRLTRSHSHTLRQPRMTRSRTSYCEDSDEDDEDFSLQSGQPLLTSASDNSSEHHTRASRSKRGASYQPQYVPLPSDTSEDEDEITLCQGQPIVKSMQKKVIETTMNSNKKQISVDDDDDDDDGSEFRFFVHRKDLEEIKKLFDPLSTPNFDLNIWRLKKNLLQKYNLVETSHVQTFQSTNSYLGYMEEGPELFVPIVVSIVKYDQARKTVKVALNSDFLDDGYRKPLKKKIKASGTSPHTNKRRGRLPKAESAKKRTKRKQSNAGDSATPRKRGRPRKSVESVEASVTPSNEVSDNKSKEINETLKQPFLSYLKMLLFLAVDEKGTMPPAELEQVETLDKFIENMRNQVLEISNFNSSFQEDLDNRPDMDQADGSVEKVCQGSLENEKRDADKTIKLQGKYYNWETLLNRSDDATTERKYCVSSELGEKSENYHFLRHYKYNLLQKCSKKLHSKGKEKLGLQTSLQLDTARSEGFDQSENKQLSTIETLKPTEVDVNGDREALPREDEVADIENVIKEIMTDLLQKVEGNCVERAQSVSCSKPVTAALHSTVKECLDDQQWIEQEFRKLIGAICSIQTSVEKKWRSNV